MPKATREASYDVATGTSTVGDIPAEATPAGSVNGTKPRALLSPGSMGPELRGRKVLGTDERLYIGYGPIDAETELYVEYQRPERLRRLPDRGGMAVCLRRPCLGHQLYQRRDTDHGDQVRADPELDPARLLKRK